MQESAFGFWRGLIFVYEGVCVVNLFLWVLELFGSVPDLICQVSEDVVRKRGGSGFRGGLIFRS